ncbi:MAG: hypothetical protein IID08_06725 [Candidatus Hydrogenedentes bacterium]|nr:hypothetical protein [Candidatus Hydrogenedentota bacterium]
MVDDFDKDKDKDEETEGKEESGEQTDDFGALTGGDDSGGSSLGNLPPLSDFDSTGDADALSVLPPMDGTSGEQDSPLSGLPPITDIKVDTPAVRGSDLDTPTNREPIESPEFDTPTSDLDTPEPVSGLGFQDFAADSDFSPETPEIGPGPDSDIDTPMFDSAFGGEVSDFGSGGGTPAPTQAMETPMFDDTGQSPVGGTPPLALDDSAFGAQSPAIPTPAGDEAIGTPIPDFSPDTGVPQGPVAGKAGGGRFGKVASIAIPVGVGVVMMLAGLFLRPMMPFFPEPGAEELAVKDAENRKLQKQIDQITAAASQGGQQISPAELQKLVAEIEENTAELNKLLAEIASLDTKVRSSRENLATIENDIAEKSGEFVVAEEGLEDLINEMEITKARHDGLLSENTRLTSIVGELEDATARQMASKGTLLHNLDLLIVQVEEGTPLTPEKYSYERRVAKAVTLRAKVTGSKWVTPALLNEYTDLYLDELLISASREYFFAKIPVHDGLGTESMRWAECLMNGNWSVYFRTIDGKHVGSYENVSGTQPPQYAFREDLPQSVRTEIEDQIIAARIEGYEEKIAVLDQKQAVFETKSGFQTRYNSL